MFSKTNIYETGWIEVVFEGRNQSYGAFNLRKQEGHTTFVSMLSVMAFFAVLLAIPFVFKLDRNGLINSEVPFVPPIDDIITLTNWPPQPPVPPVNNPKPSTSEIFKVVPDKDVTKTDTTTDKPATIAGTGTATTGSATTGSGTTLGGTNDTAGTIKVSEKDDVIFVGSSVMPEFPGGDDALKSVIGKFLMYPPVALNNGTQGKVLVSVVVERDGSISNITTINKYIGDGLEDEAMRVVSKLPKWKPGLQNGKPVRVRVTIPIKYRLQ